MSLNGVWKIEMLGPYGWEGMATAFLQDGRYWSGGADHHSIGRYEQMSDSVTVDTKTVVYQARRTLFGKHAPEYRVRFEGRLAGDTIEGHAQDAEGGFLVRFRASKVADL